MKRSKNPTVSRRKLARQALLLAMLGAAAYTAPASAQNPCGVPTRTTKPARTLASPAAAVGVAYAARITANAHAVDLGPLLTG